MRKKLCAICSAARRSCNTGHRVLPLRGARVGFCHFLRFSSASPVRLRRHPDMSPRSAMKTAWLSLTLSGLLVVLGLVYVILPAQSVNAAGSEVSGPGGYEGEHSTAEGYQASAPALSATPVDLAERLAASKKQSETHSGSPVQRVDAMGVSAAREVRHGQWSPYRSGHPQRAEDFAAVADLERYPEPPAEAGTHRAPQEDFESFAQSLQRLQDRVRTLERHRYRASDTGTVSSLSAEDTADPHFHTVRSGETLSGIAARHGLATGCLFIWNELGNAHRIYPGQRLRLSGNRACAHQDAWMRRHPVKIPSDTPYVPTRADWVIVAMNSQQVALSLPQQGTRLFAVGEKIPGAGTVMALDSRRQLVITTQGAIHALRR